MNVRVLVEPMEPTVAEPLSIRVEGLTPGTEATVVGVTAPFGAAASARFRADGAGRVDLATSAPVSGDYAGMDPMGLFWSAQLPDGSHLGDVLRVSHSAEPLTTTISVRVAEEVVASCVVRRRPHADGIRRTPVADGRLRGTLFSADDGVARPGVLLLAGSSGGVLELSAALLASRGFAVLALGYFNYLDLPPALVDIPLEYFREGLDWMAARPEVAGDRVAVVGQSRGGELALLLGATFPSVAAVVSVVPSTVLFGSQRGPDPAQMSASWTLDGQPLPLVPAPFSAEMIAALTALATGAPLPEAPISGLGMMRDALRAADSGALEAATIPVERTQGPILMLTGDDDQVWPSGEFADRAVTRLRASAFPFPYEHVSYPGAGHTIAAPPYLPTTLRGLRHELMPLVFDFGGSPRATATAQVAAAERVVEFLQQHLARVPAATR